MLTQWYVSFASEITYNLQYTIRAYVRRFQRLITTPTSLISSFAIAERVPSFNQQITKDFETENLSEGEIYIASVVLLLYVHTW